MREIIQIHDLTRDYGGGKGIFNLSFSIHEGEVFGFLGPNGAGKTTAIRHLMGYLRPRQGYSRIEGKDCWKAAPEVQRHLGYIPGEMVFPEDMTGAEFLDFYARYRGMKNDGRRKELIDRFSLDTKGPVKKMSKGTKQKVGIVAAFMHDPSVYILDEPTSGLDPLMQSRFIKLVLEEKQRGKTILMSSHMFDEIERTCDRIGIIRAGRMADIDTVETLKTHQIKRYVITFDTPEDARQFAASGFEAEADGTRVNVIIRKELKPLFQELSKYAVANLSEPAQGLEEIFLSYYGGDQA